MRIRDWSSDVCSSDLDPESALLRLHVTGETLISDIVKPALLSLRMPQFDDTALVGARWGRCARQRCIRFQKSAFRLYSLRVTCLPCLSDRIGTRCLKSFKPHFIGGRDHRSEEHTSELPSQM